MHNLALALSAKGDEVTGSDDTIFEPSASRLQQKGLLPKEMGWFPQKITLDLDAVILGMHAKGDNPELLKAQDLGLTIYSYPEFLYQQSKDKTRVVIGGSHGKTTITSMILHVMGDHDRDLDFMVGAQLEGFDTMVRLTQHNDFMLLEGDEYLSSALDLRPKFHWYQPNIALLSGIAWDHINVFPTFEDYCHQFKLFIEQITPGGALVYNDQDPVLKTLVETTDHPIKKYPYSAAPHVIVDGETFLETAEGPMPVAIFGQHNLSNLEGARWVCQLMGIDAEDFYEAIVSFKGASKRLEKLADRKNFKLFKDFAHAPSKVSATTQAVKAQYPNFNLTACLELHTYSSLNEEFIAQYRGALDAADTAVVFYTPEALALKNRPVIAAEAIVEAFGRPDLVVITDPQELSLYLKVIDREQTALLLMSSGNYGGLDLTALADGQ